MAHYEAQPDFITPDKYKNEIVAFVKRGLKDLSISRTTFDWGVPVPGDDNAGTPDVVTARPSSQPAPTVGEGTGGIY